MFGERYTITMSLSLLSDMHIGAAGDLSNTQHICLDGDNMPVIPATSIKGLIRNQLVKQGDDTCDTIVFGEKFDVEKQTGKIGKLWLGPALLDSISPDSIDKLVAPDTRKNPPAQQNINGVFEATHLAIDSKTGAAAGNQLFRKEMVAAGAKFTLTADWFGAMAGEDLECLAKTIGVLSTGIFVGSGSGLGNGKLEFCGLAKIIEYKADKTGKLVPAENGSKLKDLTSAIAAFANNSATQQIKLTLTSGTPFLTKGYVENRGSADTEITHSLKRNDTPEMWASSLAGVLRSRARWLVELDKAKNADKSDYCAGTGNSRADNPKTVLKSFDQLASLSSVERIFGCTGWKRRLGVVGIKSTGVNVDADHTRVSIDRVTGGSVEGALFTQKPFICPTFEAILTLNPKGLTEKDYDLIKLLLTDIRSGLEIGHGASIGYGWFACKIDGQFGGYADEYFS